MKPIQTGIPKDLAEDMQNPIDHERGDDIPRELLAHDFANNDDSGAPSFSNLENEKNESRYDLPDEDFSPTLSGTPNGNSFQVGQVTSFEKTVDDVGATLQSNPEKTFQLSFKLYLMCVATCK